MRQIILDTETTGLNAQSGDRLVEIGCIELLNRRPTGNNRHYYINPERDSEEGALKVHGLTRAFLSDKPTFDQIAQDLMAYLNGVDEVIIHNAPFDVGFLDAELERAGHPPFATYAPNVVDTLVMAKQLFPGKRNNLDALCTHFGVDNSARKQHGALLDAELLAEVYICLTRGQNALEMQVESDFQQEGSMAIPQIDLSSLDLPVLRAQEDELLLHEQILTALDKASSAKTLWRTL